MSASRPSANGAQRVGSTSTRLLRFWRGLPHERRLAALAAIGLFLTLFLPWYQETVIASGVTSLRSVSASLTGWGSFSFVEAAVLLVAAAVLTLLFIRAEGGAFHVPGGDGGVITAAGLWTCLLIIWRMFDKEGTTGHGQYATTAGIEWGIFVALGVAALLTYAGSRIRHAHEPEPPLPGDGDLDSVAVPSRSARRWDGTGGRPARDRNGEQTRPSYRGPEMEADDTWTAEPGERRGRQPEPGRGANPEPVRDGETARRTQQPRSEADTRIMGSPPPPPSSGEASEPPTAAPGASGQPSSGARRRIRPRSVGAPAETPPSPGRREATPGTAPGRHRATPAPPPDGPGAAATPPPGRLDRREIQELDIAEPPTARLGRSRPRTARDDDAEDQVTVRLKRPN
jgi:hypothetical protein